MQTSYLVLVLRGLFFKLEKNAVQGMIAAIVQQQSNRLRLFA